MAEAIAMKTCRTIIRENPVWAKLHLVLACAVGILLWCLLNWWIAYTAPVEPELLAYPGGKPYQIETRTVGGAWLFMTFKSDPSALCVRNAVHLLYRDPPGQPREFFPLASGLSAPSFPGSVGVSSVRFLLPVGFPTGRWNYVYRAHYGCPPMELIPHTAKLGPIDIDVPYLADKDYSSQKDSVR